MDDVASETRILRANLARQKQIFESKRNEVALMEQAIQRHKNMVHLMLFPPIRPDRNPAYISSLIKEKCAELIQLQNAITAQETKLYDRESSLSQGCDKRLTQLKMQRTTIYANLEHLRSLLCPIRLLPVELLSEIFTLSSDPVGSPSLSNPIFAVSHVCSSWRNIAIHKSELWSSLRLEHVHFATRPDGVIPLAGLWLGRSGDHPLRLFFQLSLGATDTPGPTLIDLFVQLIRLYTPHFARWKDVFFEFHRFPGEHELFSDIPQNASLPHLERFGMTASTVAVADLLKIFQLLGQAPKLKRLTWITKAQIQAPMSMFSQLTQLEVGAEHSLANALTILSHAKCLRILDIIVFVRSGSISTNVVQVVNDSLQEFTLTCAGEISVLFDSLTLPAIQHLHVSKTFSWEVTGPSIWSQWSFVQLLCRSKCDLTSLGVINYRIPSDEVLVLLRHLSPSLVKFKIEGYHLSITDEVLTALTFPSEDPLAAMSSDTDDPPTILCPMLRDLQMLGCMSTTDGVLARMVESRQDPPAGLAKLTKGVFGLDSTKSCQDRARILALNAGQTHNMIVEETGWIVEETGWA